MQQLLQLQQQQQHACERAWCREGMFGGMNAGVLEAC
jgi:hypothetical protein